MKDVLYFLRTYRDWVSLGAPQEDVNFIRTRGLCNNIGVFMIGDVLRANKAVSTLVNVFLPPEIYPFNDDADDFRREAEAGLCHLNERRNKWIADTLSDYEKYGEEQFLLRKAWQRHEHTRVALNKAVRSIYAVGDPVQVLWGKRGWIDASVSWVPYENGPTATHIYVMIPGHKTVKRWDMGGGMFHNIRKPQQ